MARLVTDRVIVALHYTAISLVVVLTLSVCGAIAFTKGIDDLLRATEIAAIVFGLPAAGAFALEIWFDGQIAKLEGHPGERHVIPKDSPARQLFRTPVSGYLIAISATLVAWGIRAALDSALPGAPFVIFFGSIMFSGWAGGYGPSVLAIAMGALIARYFYMEPLHAIALADTTSAVRLASFLFVGLIVGGLTAALRAALLRVHQLAEQVTSLGGNPNRVT